MKFSVEEFRDWKNKKVTLLGMSGVGKTYLSSLLRRTTGSTIPATTASAPVTWMNRSWT